jgi:hypothetical protein
VICVTAPSRGNALGLRGTPGVGVGFCQTQRENQEPHQGMDDVITYRFLLQSAAAAAAYSAQGFQAARAENPPGVTDTENQDRPDQ